MSRRTAVIEEFDDDTDLPLPTHSLPNTGTQGPLLEEIQDLDISDDEFDPQPTAGPASPPSRKSQFRPDAGGGSRPDAKNMVTDITPYKSWTCIYPIYLDAKRPYGRGQRRVERAKSLWWPLSKDIAEAANRLGLGTLHEVNKSHPRDWDNPGRVRVQWKKDGKLVNPIVKTKKQLLEMICYQIQLIKPENVPKAPFNTTPSDPSATAATATPAPASTTSNKGKQPAATKSKTPAAPPSYSKKASGRRLPIPPEPLPPLNSRVSPYSPAISTGVLIDTVKAGMNAPEAGALGAPAGGMANMGKGKRKVIRVRG